MSGRRSIHRTSFISVMFWGATVAFSPPAQALVPDQYIAKLYTEALGRIPDQPGWAAKSSYFSGSGCSVATLKTIGRDFDLTTEFSNLGYDNAAKLLTLYRGALNREPDPGGFNYFLNLLNSGTAWSTVVDMIFNSSEFSTLSTSICSASTTGYNWGTHPVMNLVVTTTGFQGGTGAQLQSLLNSTPSGGTVFLAQKSVTRLTTTLVVPAGVTLATTGVPILNKYALMGRLVRDSGFDAEAVRLNSNAKLKNVWVDGRRNLPQFYVGDAINVRLYGGTGTTVENCRLDNSRGWTTLNAVGWDIACGSNTIRRNLITAYSSSHSNSQWTDGISIGCENALVENNEVIDATDVPIILFRSEVATQRSTVRNNLILNAGNSAYGGLAVDSLFGAGRQYDFTGATMTANTLWTGSRVHYDIGIAVGTRAWFGASADPGIGVSVTNNTTGSLPARVDLGIGVSYMLNVYVQGNTLTMTHVNSSACQTLDVVAAVSAGHASGSIQPYTDQLIGHCIAGH